MNILYIWDADYPWDVRVEKICSTLKSNGHEIHIASRNLKKNAIYENLDGINIHRIKTWKNDKLNYFFTFPLFFSPVWKSFLDDIIKKSEIDIIIVRDLPMAIAGIWAGKRSTVPVIFDMAEDYVAMIRDIWKVRKYQGLNLVIRNPYLAKYVERYSFKHSDQILVVVDEAIEVVEQGGGSAKNITIVSNTPDLASFSNQQVCQNKEIELIKNYYSAIYTGGLQMGRGLQYVLEAIPEIIQNIPDFLFVIVGDGYAKEILKKIIKEKSIEKYVFWIGWVDHSELYDYVKACQVGVIPHLVTNHVSTTIPNKIFDYMGCGLPVVASDAKPMKRIIDEAQCGVTFENANAESLAKAVLFIHDSDTDYGKNGENAVQNKYNWREDEKRLNDMIVACKNEFV